MDHPFIECKDGHPFAECKDRHCPQHEAIWDRLELCGEVDIAEDTFERLNVDPVRHEEAMKLVCTSYERTLGEHTPEEYLDCVRKAVSRRNAEQKRILIECRTVIFEKWTPVDFGDD